MQNIKGGYHLFKKRRLLFILSIILTALISIVTYHQITKANESKKTDERLATIEERVQDLFESEKKEDISENITEKQLIEIELLIDNEKSTKFTKDQEELFERIKHDYDQAQLMFDITNKINALFTKNGAVKENADIDEIIKELESSDLDSEEFKKAKLKILRDAEEELELIDSARSIVYSMFTEDDKVKESIGRDDIATAEKALKKIDNEKVVKSLREKLNIVDEELSKREQQEQQAKAKENEKQSEISNNQSEQQNKQNSHEERASNKNNQIVDEINKLELRLLDLDNKRIAYEQEAAAYPSHSEEHREALENSIDILLEMEEIIIKLDELYGQLE